MGDADTLLEHGGLRVTGTAVVKVMKAYPANIMDTQLNHIFFVEDADAIKAKGVDTIACISVNDAFVMGAWAREQKTDAKVRMLGDGSADFSKATGLTLDLTSRGMGVRSNRYSMLVKDGKVATLNVEGPGKFEVSDASTLLAQAKG